MVEIEDIMPEVTNAEENVQNNRLSRLKGDLEVFKKLICKRVDRLTDAIYESENDSESQIQIPPSNITVLDNTDLIVHPSTSPIILTDENSKSDSMVQTQWNRSVTPSLQQQQQQHQQHQQQQRQHTLQ